MSAPVCVWLVSVSARAMPKSATFATPSAVTSTFSGLMSRWTTPAAWARDRAMQTGSTSASASAGLSRPRSRRTWRSDGPSTCSMTM
jgi:hypothetical protein